MANTRSLIAVLLARYGNWGCCVATSSGEVVSSAHYALAAKRLGLPIRVYTIEDHLANDARRIFQHVYGVFSYAHLPRETYLQTLAQPYRLRTGGKRDGKSVMYERILIPQWKDRERVLDFGCGQADYVRQFQARGRQIQGIEFFHRHGDRIDARAVHHMIDQALSNWATRGGYDHVMCDSVLNSIDSAQAERDVLVCAYAFGRPGAKVYFSGRQDTGGATLSEMDAQDKVRRGTEFLDADGFTAVKRGKGWFFQKYHTPAEVRQKLSAIGFQDVKITAEGWKWMATATVDTPLPETDVRDALSREFNLPWPAGQSVNRHREALAAYERAQLVDKTRHAERTL